MIRRTFVLRESEHVQALWAFLNMNWRAAADAGQPLSAEIAEFKGQRSTKANRLYWARLNEIAQSAWVDSKQFSPEAWHAFFAAKFIGTEEGPGGTQPPISTSTLNTSDFAEYLTRIEVYAATELGIELLS